MIISIELVNEKDHNDVLEATTSALRALIQRGVDENCSDFIETFTADDLNVSNRNH